MTDVTRRRQRAFSSQSLRFESPQAGFIDLQTRVGRQSLHRTVTAFGGSSAGDEYRPAHDFLQCCAVLLRQPADRVRLHFRLPQDAESNEFEVWNDVRHVGERMSITLRRSVIL